jgi:hypothetical protein
MGWIVSPKWLKAVVDRVAQRSTAAKENAVLVVLGDGQYIRSKQKKA